MPTSHRHWTQLAWAGNILYWLVLISWVAFAKQPSDSVYVISCTLICIISGFIVLNPWNSDLFEPLKLVAFFYGWSFGLGPFLLAPVGAYQFPYLGGAWERLLSEGALLALLGLLALVAGYYLLGSHAKAITTNAIPTELSQTERSTISKAGIGLLVIGGAAYAGLVYEAGGLAHFLLYTGGRADIFNGGFGGLYWAAFFLISGLNAIGSAQVKNHPFFVMALALTIGIIFIPFQGREEVIAPIICGLFLVHYGRKSISLKWITTAAIVLIVMASFLAYFRNAEKSSVYKNTDSFVSGYVENFSASLLKTLAHNIEQMDAFLIAVRYVELSHKTLEGATLLSWLEPIDRHVLGGILGSEHPGRFMTILINPEHRWSQTALSPSILGELYLNYAVPGVIVGLFLYGLAIRWLHAKISMTRYSPTSLMLYPYTIWIISKVVIDGSVHLFRPLVVIAPLLLIHLVFFFHLRPITNGLTPRIGRTKG
jgi:hypothetical protein